MQAHEGMDALKFNLRQEHVVICDFVSTFHQVLLLLRLCFHAMCFQGAHQSCSGSCREQ